MGMLHQILVISAVIALTQAECGGNYKLHPGDEITIAHEETRRGRCMNKFRCADSDAECNIVVKCSEFSFPGNGRCRPNSMRVKAGPFDYGKFCDSTGAPDFTVYYGQNVKIMAKGRNFKFECHISLEAADDDGHDDYNYDYTDYPDYTDLPPTFPQDTTTGGVKPTAAPTTAAPAATTTAGSSNSSSSCCATYTPASDTRIVGGVAVEVGEFPWQAALRTTSGRHFCGGTIISKSWILTAQHCVEGSRASDIKIYLGDHHMDNSDGEIVHSVSRIVSGPNNHDIALLKLSTPATFSDRVKPACLPTSLAGNSLEGKHLWVTGWGTTSVGGGGDISKTLLKVYVPVVSNKVCADNYSPKYTVGAHELCAGKPGKDSCQGDSGGPAVYADGAEKRAYIVGVVSWGVGCANEGYPGVYVRVTSYIDWIKSTTKGDGVCDA